jgi:uncharacterized Zn-binding protein involved in type VI secretion
MKIPGKPNGQLYTCPLTYPGPSEIAAAGVVLRAACLFTQDLGRPAARPSHGLLECRPAEARAVARHGSTRVVVDI